MSDQPPARQPHRSHWLHRAAFLLTVAAVVLGLAGFTLYRDQQRLRERASTSAQNIAALLDQSIASAFDKVDSVLLSTEQLYQQRGHGGLPLGIPPAAVNAQLRRVSVCGATETLLVDRDVVTGHLRCSTSALAVELLLAFSHAGYRLVPDDIVRMPSVCCGGCSG